MRQEMTKFAACGQGRGAARCADAKMSGLSPGDMATRDREAAEARAASQARLCQAQKLESVGRLASGIAHELNTPIQFVGDSVHFVRDVVGDLFALIDKLKAVQRSVLEGAPSAEAAAEAAEAEKQADLAYLVENVPRALDRSAEGLERVAEIVASMKHFAHPNQQEMSSLDLNHAVRSCLTIARNEYKYVADLETRFGDLPLVVCHPGDVHQAVLNILVNAAHAIGDAVRGTDRKGRITIRTAREGDSAVVEIGDTGGGIPLEIRDRVFDPFFTTKEVGKGTGQGLSLARHIVVEKHGGDLKFETKTGEGTTFVVRLPIGGTEDS